jgi:maltose alpha-D-glucosyltransferase / alpha-amylase
MQDNQPMLDDDPLWYKDAVIYQLHIKSFYDGNDDGIGDFRGLIQKLDYLENLGVTALWLLPFYPSPQRDDGYDISDYYNVHPDYGTLRDFRRFLNEAHKRGLRVITELVINHTSDQHPWFQKARHAKPGSPERDFYVWSDTPDKYQEARIIFQDFESSNWSWDGVANAYYWHRFYSHQPDLNFDNPRVQDEIIRALDFWLGMGVDGLRLDAIPYLYEREGTNCENLPETHAFLKKLRAHVDEKYENRMLLAEANQWPEDAVAYFGDGDECHTAFHFPVMPRLFMSLRMEDRFPMIDILEQTPTIPETCQWLMFLRNHDELTLEMVTDEERDYMYRVYTQDPRARINLGIRRRLAPLLENNRKKLELMNTLLFSLPGSPVIYYGDEIGMGDNYYLGDRNGVRTPMQWSPDRNAGFSKVNPQRLFLPVIIDPEYQYEVINVENQDRNGSSLLWWMRHAIGMRKRYKAFGRGSLKFIASDNPQVLAFVREFEDERILVLANLSKYTQMFQFNLSEYAGYTPVEVFSQNRLMEIRDTLYPITMGPFDYHWFALEKEDVVIGDISIEDLPELTVEESWASIFEDSREFTSKVLPNYLRSSRWFGSKGRVIQRVQITEALPVALETSTAYLLFIEVSYREGAPEIYLLPVAYAGEERREMLMEYHPRSIIARIRTNGDQGILYDSLYDEPFRGALLSMIATNTQVEGKTGQLVAYPGKAFGVSEPAVTAGLSGSAGLNGSVAPIIDAIESSRVLEAEQSNSAILYGDTYFLKLFRRLEEGVNPDLEIEEFLTEETDFANVPPFAGGLQFRRSQGEPIAMGLLQTFVPNQGDAWSHFLQAVTRYFERILERREEVGDAPRQPASLFGITMKDVPPLMLDLIGLISLDMAALLGQRTGEMHIALASSTTNPAFQPEPFSTLYQRSLYQSMRTQARKTVQTLRQMKNLPEHVGQGVQEIINAEDEILSRLQQVTRRKILSEKIRIHGDYHLGQVLYTGKDFIIIDFEGEPAVSLGERRLKRSGLRDVAGMVRSFHYAAYGPLRLASSIRPEDAPALEPWADLWFSYVSGIFIQSYRATVAGKSFVPDDSEGFEILTQVHLLHKAIYELNYELNNRPDWLTIPVKGIQHILEGVKVE